MRARITILCGFLLFTVLPVTPAYAGPWSAFIAWLSDLDPKTGGLGLEVPLYCSAQTTDPVTNVKSSWVCGPTKNPSTVVKGSVAFMMGTLNSTGGTMFASPVLGIVERQTKRVYYGAGIGAIHLGGTLNGGITRGLLQVNVTLPIPVAHFGIRGEVNVIPKGFPAGTFRPGGPATGTETAFGLAFVYLR